MIDLKTAKIEHKKYKDGLIKELEDGIDKFIIRNLYRMNTESFIILNDFLNREELSVIDEVVDKYNHFTFKINRDKMPYLSIKISG